LPAVVAFLLRKLHNVQAEMASDAQLKEKQLRHGRTSNPCATTELMPFSQQEGKKLNA